MRCLSVILTLLPTFAAAEWQPSPSLFNYAATKAICTANPDDPNLTQACSDQLVAAFMLKRAVARAAHACYPTDLSACPLPFEEEGLPAIAAEIAIGVGCETSDLAAHPPRMQLAADHCVTVISDILIDEGVVPLDAAMNCNTSPATCEDLSGLHAALWRSAVLDAAPNDPLIADLLVQNLTDCDASAASKTEAARCLTTRNASLWADLALQTEQDN